MSWVGEPVQSINRQPRQVRRPPSRLMPKLPVARTGVIGWAVLLVLGLYVAWLVSEGFRINPIATWVAIGVVAAFMHFSTKSSRALPGKLKELAEKRSGESICEFARQFNTRDVDPWVIRAVYEQLQDHLSPMQENFPVKADDRLMGDLICDPDDLDMDIVVQVSKRTGRSLENPKNNPFYERVHTAGDLVYFFNAQPLNKPS